MVKTNVTTAKISGVTAVEFDRSYPYFAVRNDGSSAVHVSATVPECVAGTDGVVTVAAGGSYVANGGGNVLYLNGGGTVTVQGQFDKFNPFKVAAKGGGGNEVPENHNNIFRGDDLFAKGYTIDDICEMIADGSFSDIYIGDYFTLSGTIPGVPCYVEQTGDDGAKTLVESTQTVTYNTKFRVAGLDMYLNAGDGAFSKHHAVIVPDGIIGINRMNDSNITTGGYLNSFMFASVLPVYNTHFSAADKFGSHLLSYRSALSNTVSGNMSSSLTWTDVKISLMSEPEACGGMIFGGKYDVGVSYKQLPLFRIAPKFVHNRNWYWLRAVANSANFAGVGSNGNASNAYSSITYGVRPTFVIG